MNENMKSVEVHLIKYNDGIVDIGGFKCAFSFYDGINTTIVNKQVNKRITFCGSPFLCF